MGVNKYEKPPIGIMPKKVYDKECNEKRFFDITSAMIRYSEANMVIPKEWIEELERRYCRIASC